MIKINFPEPDNEDWKEWCQRCKNECDKLIEAYNHDLPIKIDQRLYKEFKSVFIDPDGPFKGKCAYCEEKIYSNQHGDIEHYRPKAKVTDINYKPIIITKNDGEIEHPGYFWLAYNWENLLASCVLCNQPSSDHSGGRPIGKRNSFPVLDFRASKPGEETRETPLLINPVLEDPRNFLDISNEGVLFAKNENSKGQITINLLGLNERNLPTSRKEVYDNTRNKLGVITQAISTNTGDQSIQQRIEEIRRIREGHGEFAIAARKALKDSFSALKPFFDLLDN